MLYNSNSWSVPTTKLKKLDVTHRRHLRKILNIKWPNGRISNNELYNRCKTYSLSQRVLKYRWTMFGHILRSDKSTPAFCSLKFALSNSLKGRRGRHQSNLCSTLKCDLKSRNLKLTNLNDLCDLRELAMNRNRWRDLY